MPIIFSISVCISFVSFLDASISCLDEDGKAVDWWIILKAPVLPNSTDPSAVSGFGYAYCDARNRTMKFTGKRLDNNLSGALASTLQQIYDNVGSSSVAFFMYNDESPDGKTHESYGHTKGEVCYNRNSGFWLVHSTPRWPPLSSNDYQYPPSEKEFGQSFLCMNFETNSFNDIAGQFLLNKPYLYDYNFPTSLHELTPQMQSFINREFFKTSSNQTIKLTTVDGINFISFAKNSAWALDLYEDFVSPYFDTDLFIDSWMNGNKENAMPSYCSPQYAYDNVNVRLIYLSESIFWKETKDHSKWAVSAQENEINLYCIGDLNREFSQAKRGGGTVGYLSSFKLSPQLCACA